PVHEAGRVRRCPAAEPRRVVAGAVIVKAGLRVTFLACITVALRSLDAGSYGLVGGAAYGVVLLVADDPGIVVECEHRRSEVVAELVAHQFARAVVSACGPSLDQGDPLLVIADAQGFALEGHRAEGVVFAIDLEGADVDPLMLTGGGLGESAFGDLAGPLPGRVVQVVGGLLAAAGGAVQAVVLVPGQYRDFRHSGGVALLVVGEGLWRRDGGGGGGRQAGAVPGGVEEAWVGGGG